MGTLHTVWVLGTYRTGSLTREHAHYKTHRFGCHLGAQPIWFCHVVPYAEPQRGATWD